MFYLLSEEKNETKTHIKLNALFSLFEKFELILFNFKDENEHKYTFKQRLVVVFSTCHIYVLTFHGCRT